MLEKLKSYVRSDAVFYTVLILCTALISYGLGARSYVSATPPVEQGVTIEQVSVNQSASLSKASQPETIETIVASRSGTKYHLLTCPGAVQIKEENKVFFASEIAAQAAGYTRAANCEFE